MIWNFRCNFSPQCAKANNGFFENRKMFFPGHFLISARLAGKPFLPFWKRCYSTQSSSTPFLKAVFAVLKAVFAVLKVALFDAGNKEIGWNAICALFSTLGVPFSCLIRKNKKRQNCKRAAILKKCPFQRPVSMFLWGTFADFVETSPIVEDKKARNLFWKMYWLVLFFNKGVRMR